MLDLPQTPCVTPHQKPRYQPVTYFTYWPVLGYFNNCNIIHFAHTATSSDKIDKINQVFLDRISDNMDVLVKTSE